MRAASGSVQLEHEDGQTALENLLTARIGEAGKRVHLGRSRNDQVLTALRLYLRDAVDELQRGSELRSPQRSTSWRSARATIAAARLHPHAAGDAELGGAVGRRLRGRVARRRRRPAAGASVACDKNPLGSAAGYGVAEPAARSRARRAQRSASPSVHEPVTAVQLSRGKAEAQLLFEIALVMQDVGRLAADLLLFYTQEFSFVDAAGRVHDRLVDHAAEAQPGRVRADPRPHAPRRRPVCSKCWASSRSCRPAISAICS